MQKITTVLVIVLAFVAYALGGLIGLQAHSDPIEMDTTSYLETAYEIRQAGGVLQFIPNCLKGVYRQATQHPLYLLLLSVKAERHFDFFVQAKSITYGIGFLFLGVGLFSAWKLWGRGTAFVFICLLLMNATFLRLTTMVASESLLAVFFLLFWYFASRGFDWRGCSRLWRFSPRALPFLLCRYSFSRCCGLSVRESAGF